MFEIAREEIYFKDDDPESLFLARDEASTVDETMMGTRQMIDGVRYLIKGVSYRLVSPGRLTKIIIVE